MYENFKLNSFSSKKWCYAANWKLKFYGNIQHNNLGVTHFAILLFLVMSCCIQLTENEIVWPPATFNSRELMFTEALQLCCWNTTSYHTTTYVFLMGLSIYNSKWDTKVISRGLCKMNKLSSQNGYFFPRSGKLLKVQFLIS